MPREGNISQRLEVRDLTVAFGANVIQRGLSFSIRPGSIFAIMGGSGCGKSTVLKAMIGLLTPANGTVLVDGEDYWTAGERRRVEIRRRFGVLFQGGALWSSMTVGENVALPLQMFTRLDPAAIGMLVDLKLALVGLAGAGGKMPSELSGGMRKRVGLARAVAMDPAFILYDEPTTGLDPIMADVIDELIRSLQRRMSVTSIVVTHDLRSAFEVGDRLAMLLNGHIVASGTPAELQASRDPVVRQFLEGTREGPIQPV